MQDQKREAVPSNHRCCRGPSCAPHQILPCSAFELSFILRNWLGTRNFRRLQPNTHDATNSVSPPLDRTRGRTRSPRGAALRMDHHRAQGQALRARVRRLRRRPQRAGGGARHRRASSGAVGDRNRARRRGDHHAVHFHRDRRVLAYLGARPLFVDIDRARSISARRESRRRSKAARIQGPRGDAGAFRRPGLRDGSHPRDRAQSQSQGRGGRRPRRSGRSATWTAAGW